MDRKTVKETVWQTMGQMDRHKLSDRQTVTGAVGQTNGQIDIQTVKETDRQTKGERKEKQTKG